MGCQCLIIQLAASAGCDHPTQIQDRNAGRFVQKGNLDQHNGHLVGLGPPDKVLMAKNFRQRQFLRAGVLLGSANIWPERTLLAAQPVTGFKDSEDD